MEIGGLADHCRPIASAGASKKPLPTNCVKYVLSNSESTGGQAIDVLARPSSVFRQSKRGSLVCSTIDSEKKGDSAYSAFSRELATCSINTAFQASYGSSWTGQPNELIQAIN